MLLNFIKSMVRHYWCIIHKLIKSTRDTTKNKKIKSIGKHTYFYGKIEVLSWGEDATLEIGSFCAIASNLKVFLGGNHRADWVTTYPFGHRLQKIFNKFNGIGHPKTNGNVIIGNDVWIGRDVTIMSGVKIGDGAIIGANSHVVSNVKPYSVVVGNPAEFLYSRFDEDTKNKLCKLKWWELDDDTINNLTPLLCSNNVRLLIKELEKIRGINQ